MTLKQILHNALLGVGVMILAVSILGAKEVLAVCDISKTKKRYSTTPPTSWCYSHEGTGGSVSTGCGDATINSSTGFWSETQAVYSCGTDGTGDYCFCHVEACDTACSGGGVSCGVYPQCGGACSGGNVCKAIAATGSCNCGTPTSCDEYVPDPNLLATTRLSPTSAKFNWSAIDTTAFPYVERIALVVEDNEINRRACVSAALAGDSSAACNVYQPNLAVTSTSYTATGALTAGTEYDVLVIFISPNPSPYLPDCEMRDMEKYLSSCELTPDPTTVDVGGTRTLTTTLAADTWNVSYSRSPTAYATVTTPDNASPFRTTVTGVADGVVSVTGDVYADSAPTTLATRQVIARQ